MSDIFILNISDFGNVLNFLHKNFFFKKSILPIFTISLILLILVPFIGVEIKGSKRWLDLFIFRLQPIELIKPFFVLICASLFSSGKEISLNFSYLISLILLSIIIILLLIQPDIGQSILLIFTWVSIVFYFRYKNKLYFIFVWCINCLFNFPFINFSREIWIHNSKT